MPETAFDVPLRRFDFSALQIGVAAYEEGPTGCTVFRFANDPTSVIDVRGGYPGTIHGSSEEDTRTAAICFAGGSSYGVEAATGVAAEIFAESGYADLKLVRGAITYDFGRDNDNMIYPDKALGRAALKSARTGVFPLGRAGVGCGLTCGDGFGGVQGERTGQGGAFRQVGTTKLAVFTAVNAAGAIVDRQGQVVRGHLDPKTGKRYHYRELLERKLASGETSESPQGKNTTLTLVHAGAKEPTVLQWRARCVMMGASTERKGASHVLSPWSSTHSPPRVGGRAARVRYPGPSTYDAPTESLTGSHRLGRR